MRGLAWVAALACSLVAISSSPSSAALRRFSLQRVPIHMSHAGFGASGFGVFSLANGSLALLARAGDPEPGGNGSYRDISRLTYGRSGHVAFHTTLNGSSGGAGDDEAIYRSDGAATIAIAREGQPLPDGLGAFSFLRPLFVDAAGNVFFSARIGGAAGVAPWNDSGVFRGDGSAPVTLVREGDSAFGGPEAIGELFVTAPRYRPAATGAAALTLPLVGAGVSSWNDSALMLADGATRVRIAREGDGSQGGVLPSLLGSALGGDAAGNVAFQVLFAPTTRRLLRGSGGALEQIAATGDPFLDSTLGELVVSGQSSVNAAGQISFWARLVDARELLLLHTPGAGTAVVAVRGQPLSAGGSIRDIGGSVDFIDPELDASGRVVFRASIEGAGSPAPEALFIWQAGVLGEQLRTGDAAPGGGAYTELGEHSTADALGRIVFKATVSGSRPDENAGLFRSDAGSVVELLREGTPSPDADGVVYFDILSQDQVSGIGAGALFATAIDAASDSPPPFLDAARCRDAPSPPDIHCGPHEGGTALIDDSAPAPMLRALRVLTDTTTTYSDLPIDLFLSDRRSERPAPDQAGQGSVSSAIRWGVVTGWTLTGSRWCHSVPGIVCTLIGAAPDQTTEPTAASDFYDLGTWTFHGTGFVASPFVISRFEAGNTQLRVLGRSAPNGAVPALPLAGAALLVAGVLAAARSRFARNLTASSCP